MRFFLLTALFTTTSNMYADTHNTNMFSVGGQFGTLNATISPRLGALARYDLSFRFMNNSPSGMLAWYDRTSALQFQPFIYGEAASGRTKQTARLIATTAVLCASDLACHLLNSGSDAYTSNYTPTFMKVFGPAQSGTVEICAGSTTCERHNYITSPRIVWTEAAAGTISAAKQTSNTEYTYRRDRRGFTSPQFITSPLSQTSVYVYEGGSANRILKCRPNASTALLDNCSAQSVDLSTFSNIAGLRASPSGLGLFMVADSSVYRLAVDASTGDLTGAMVRLDTGVVDLGTVKAISNGYTPNAFFVTSSSPSRLSYCETRSEAPATARCQELAPTSAALTEPTTISAFYYRSPTDGTFATYALAADGTSVKKISVNLSAGTYYWVEMDVWNFGAIVTGISGPTAYQAVTLETDPKLGETEPELGFVIGLAAVGSAEPTLGTLISLGVTSDRAFWVAQPATTPAVAGPVSGTQLL